MGRKIAPLAEVPRGTVVKMTLRLPHMRRPEEGDGFAWSASHDMTVEDARAELSRELFKTFVETFLPVE